jgi:hypothetical protein
MHGRMVETCKAFQAGNLPRQFADSGLAISPDVTAVAEAFVLLQQARHEADYNTAETFTRYRAEASVRLAHTAFEAWGRVRGQADADLLLLTMLLGARRVP